MERRPLLQSTQSEYHSYSNPKHHLRHNQSNVVVLSRDGVTNLSYSQREDEERSLPDEELTPYASPASSPCFFDAVEGPGTTEDKRSIPDNIHAQTSNFSQRQGPQSKFSVDNDQNGIDKHTEHGRQSSTTLVPKNDYCPLPESSSVQSREKGSGDHTNKILSQDGEADVIPNQRTRMFLLTLIGFFIACASKLHSPLMTQYTYQVYTEQVFGNLSAGVHISKQPCVNASDSLSDSRTRQVQSQSGDFLSRTVLIEGGMSTIINLFLGSYSDVLGRKLVLFLPILGCFLRNAAAPIVIYFDLGLPGMYLGYLLDGLFGGSMALVLGLYVYAADITQRGGQRTMGLALVEMSFGLGDCCMYVLAGLFIQDIGFFYPALVATLLLLVCIALVFFLPETVPRDRKRVISPVKTVQRMISTFVPRDNGYLRAMLLLAISGLFIVTLPLMSLTTLESLYLMDRPFCWSSLQQGILGTAKDTSSYLTSLAVIKLMSNVISTPLLAIIGLLSESAKLVVMALATDDLTVYMVVVAGCLRKLIYPGMRSFMSSLVPRERQGAMFAGIAVLESVCVCLGQMTFVNVYKVTLTFMKGFVFLAIAASLSVVIVIFIINICLFNKFKASRETVLSIQADDDDEEQVRDNDSTTRLNRH